MATFQKINSFVEALAEKKHNLASDTLKIALTNTAHDSSWSVLADLTTISLTNFSSNVLTVDTSSQTAGVYSLVLNDLILQTSGSTNAFRYIYVYNDTATNDDLIGYFDYGYSITIPSGGTLTLVFDSLLTIT